jgi:hypothetical protein
MAVSAKSSSSATAEAFVKQMQDSEKVAKFGECGGVWLYKRFGMVAKLEISGATATAGTEHHITIRYAGRAYV